ncbi:lectin C-type domain-containing protein [Aaosphaeria arxii CBS 175.79]|uniref:Maintenance of telomere capping protein 6 n=1 Tax=Aaosphaeria arxii CBS 175.79 TaxID=1450172 RepID=A0A6A5XC03_9PLEO|nr:lectin C-type domain-containing protein [Aaosphaeria arxii CBS 175.79]KAF2010450.1 lectin C-type domain-containing protein [Aaosphaeria arxii CBS 175.79]
MSSSLYDPDTAAILVQPWSEAFRSQRDVGLRIPINYNTDPAVSLQAACFAHNQYASEAFAKCFSNLLAIGFKRFYVDVYWDSGRELWSLCPAQIPPAAQQEQEQQTSPTVLTVLPNAPSVITSSASSSGSSADALSSVPAGPIPVLKVRQDESSRGSEASQTQTSSPTAPTGVSVSSSSATPSALPAPGYFESMIQVGRFNCSSQMSLSYIADILDDYFSDTDTTVEASLLSLILDIHAAASYSDPDAPAPMASNLPPSGGLLKDVVRGNLSEEVFTPDKLQSDRNNLEGSWYDVPRDQMPAIGYYDVQRNDTNQPITVDGWPTEAYIEFQRYLRILVGLGNIDPQMSNYDYTEDLGTIFRQGQLQVYHNTSIASSGTLTSGCMFDPSQNGITPETNSSWAVTNAPALSLSPNIDPQVPIASISNITSCGMGPILNTTLGSATADQNFQPYLAFTYSTLWTWAPGQPLNTSSTRHEYMNKCVAIALTGPNPNRWVTVDCTMRMRFVCQSDDEPYKWTLSPESATYFLGDEACPSGYTFTVPHTSLEQAHLISSISSMQSMDGSPIDRVYINFNSIDVPDCWTTGINATCPYQPRQDVNKTRLVVVPTVAAVIIFVLAVATFFVKCASNRTENMRGRRRRNVSGWVYEGVPS